MTPDPFTEKGVGYLNFQSVTLTAQAEMNFLAKPEAESQFAQALGDRGSQRGLQRQTISHRLRTGRSIVDLARMCQHRPFPRALVRVSRR
jgi:hypothetical protein